jgi:hypothetical protein
VISFLLGLGQLQAEFLVKPGKLYLFSCRQNGSELSEAINMLGKVGLEHPRPL